MLFPHRRVCRVASRPCQSSRSRSRRALCRGRRSAPQPHHISSYSDRAVHRWPGVEERAKQQDIGTAQAKQASSGRRQPDRRRRPGEGHRKTGDRQKLRALALPRPTRKAGARKFGGQTQADSSFGVRIPRGQTEVPASLDSGFLVAWILAMWIGRTPGSQELVPQGFPRASFEEISTPTGAIPSRPPPAPRISGAGRERTEPL